MLKTTYTVDRENNKIVVKRSFDAQRSKVWEAWTKPEILDKWFGPKPYQAVTKSFEFVPGGKWHYAMVGPEGDKSWGLTTFVEIQPEEYYIAKDQFGNEEGSVNTDLPTSGVWKNEFLEDGDQTHSVITIQYDSLQDMEKVLEMQFEEGFNMSLDNLDEFLAGHK